MLVELTPILEVVEKSKKIAIEENFDYIPQSHPKYIQEKGIYQSSFGGNFAKAEFKETEGISFKDEYPILRNYQRGAYGVADTIDQIKEYYNEEIKDEDNKYFISVHPIFQNKENTGKGGGWRWQGSGEYIGKLNPQCEYLDDEEFGNDFKYVICFHIYKVN